MNPIVLETAKLMTSIVASEKVPEDVKAQATKILSELLFIMEQDALEIKKNYSPILH